MKTTIELPLLPLRDVVVYPHMVIPLFVGREKSIEALEAAMTGDKQILLLAQKNPADDDPGENACIGSALLLLFCNCSNCRMAPSRCWWKASNAARWNASWRWMATYVPRWR